MSSNIGAWVVVVGGGGREEAIARAYSASEKVGRVDVFPGNPLMPLNTNGKIQIHPDIAADNIDEIKKFCKEHNVDLVEIGPERIIHLGLTDILTDMGITVFSPSNVAARIEWDKAYARDFMAHNIIPHPTYQVFTSSQEAEEFLSKQPDQPWFVKTSGLADGKGALPAKNTTEAVARIHQLHTFGQSGETFLLEQWLQNTDGSPAEEFSAFALFDGRHFQMIGYAQDHKRALDGDKGENTGGMGVSTPPLVIDKHIDQQTKEIFQKTLTGFKERNIQYVGPLYLGGIIVQGKVFVIEYNARWGDPEAEVLLPSLTTDYYTIAQAATSGKIDQLSITTDGKSRVAVALAADGYPGDYAKEIGKIIHGISDAMDMPHVHVIGAGIKKTNTGSICIHGGRVLYVIGEGHDVISARDAVYTAIKKISVEKGKLHYRKDIGNRDVQRVQKKC